MAKSSLGCISPQANIARSIRVRLSILVLIRRGFRVNGYRRPLSTTKSGYPRKSWPYLTSLPSLTSISWTRKRSRSKRFLACYCKRSRRRSSSSIGERNNAPVPTFTRRSSMNYHGTTRLKFNNRSTMRFIKTFRTATKAKAGVFTRRDDHFPFVPKGHSRVKNWT